MSGESQPTYRRRVFKWVVALICTAVVLFPALAMADPDRITRGDVQSVLEAYPTGGRVVLLQANHAASLHAAPADFVGTRGAIRTSESWDGGHHCVDDWHVILLGVGAGGDQAFSRQDAGELLSLVSLTFTLTREGESAVLDTRRTAIKAWLGWEDAGFEKIYGFQEGRILSPEELGVGEYTLAVDYEVDGLSLKFSSRFFIDPSDSATCTE